MAKKPKLTAKPPNKPPNVPQRGRTDVPATIPTNEPPVEGRTQKAIQRLRDSFIDWVLDNVWWGVLFAVTSATAFIWLYMRGGGAAWVYPYLNFVLGFLSACIALILLSVVTSRIKARRLKQEKNLQFVSQKKGILDHRRNIEIARKGAEKTLQAITKKLQEIGKTSNEGAAKAESAAGDIDKGHKVASRYAAKLIKHAIKMEQYVVELEQSNNLLTESTKGAAQWFLTKQIQSREELLAARQNFLREHDEVAPVIRSIESFRNTQIELGDREMLQDLNTAMNRLSNVTGDILTVLQKYKKSYADLVAMIDRKLRETNPRS